MLNWRIEVYSIKAIEIKTQVIKNKRLSFLDLSAILLKSSIPNIPATEWRMKRSRARLGEFE